MSVFGTVCGVISTALAVCCCVPYWRCILTGRTKPHQFSWLVFTIMNAVVTISQFLAGGRASVLISLTFFIGSAINLILSLRYGTRDSSRYDRGLLAFSLVTIVAWVLTNNNTLAIWLTVAIDIFATLMTLLKIHRDPHSEAPWPWIVGATAYLFSCMALVDTRFGILYVRPIYGLAGDAVVVGFVWYFIRREPKPVIATATDK